MASKAARANGSTSQAVGVAERTTDPVPATSLSAPLPTRIRTRTTIPDEIVRHDISDEELLLLEQGDRSLGRDVGIMAAGVLLGCLPGFCKGWAILTGDYPVTPTLEDLASLAVPLVALTTLVIAIVVLRFDRKRHPGTIAQKIRARSQARLEG